MLTIATPIFLNTQIHMTRIPFPRFFKTEIIIDAVKKVKKQKFTEKDRIKFLKKYAEKKAKEFIKEVEIKEPKKTKRKKKRFLRTVKNLLLLEFLEDI